MATLSITAGTGGFTYTISNFDQNFTTGNGYYRAGLTVWQFTEEAASISGIVSDSIVYAGTSGSKSISKWVPYAAGTYTFWAWAQGAGQYWPAGSATVTVKAADVTPSISSFSVSPVSGTVQGSCSWSIQNGSSAVSYEIRASASYPSSYLSGYSKGTYSYGTTSATISFNGAGKYYVWLILYKNGSYVAHTTTTVTTSLSKPSTWSWSSTESSAFSNKGAITNLTRSRWNAFIAQANLAIKYYNAVNGANLTLIYDSYQMGTSKIMYADSFNGVCAGINNLCSGLGVSNTGISKVSTGGTIYGHYFTDLSGALNRAINKME